MVHIKNKQKNFQRVINFQYWFAALEKLLLTLLFILSETFSNCLMFLKIIFERLMDSFVWYVMRCTIQPTFEYEKKFIQEWLSSTMPYINKFCKNPFKTKFQFSDEIFLIYLEDFFFVSFYWFHCYLFYNMFDLPHEKAKSTNRYRKQNLQISKIMRLNITWMLMLIWWNFFVLFSLVKAQDMGWQKKYKLISRKKICLLLQRDPERVWLKCIDVEENMF